MNSLMVFLFLVIFAAVLIAIGLGLKILEDQRAKRVKNTLAAVASADSTETSTRMLFEPEQADSLEQILARTNPAKNMRAMLQQAGLDWSLSQVALSMIIAAIAGVLLSQLFPVLISRLLSAVVIGMVFACLPVLYVRVKRTRRLHEFEKQFPEALDFLARSMRAGHAFSISLEMMGQESPDPLGQEFRVVFNEQNLGAPIDVALTSLTRRVPLLDVRFFVSTVLLQRQTGGNLSEILMRLSYIIRERFRLKGQVRAASAHGRITATILCIMPVIVAFLMMMVAPGYIPGMMRDPDGKWLLVGSVLIQFVGFLWMRSIINIKV